MFEPHIYVVAPSEYSSGITKVMNFSKPKEISGLLESSPKQSFQFNPKIELVQQPQNLDDTAFSPYIILNFFLCSSKGDFTRNHMKEIETFNQNYSRPHIQIQAIFIFDPKKLKSKTLFVQSSSLVQHIQSHIPNLQVLSIKGQGNPKKADMRKIWPVLISQIISIFHKRIKALSPNLQTEITLSTFQNSLRLIKIYNRLSLTVEYVTIVSYTEELIENHRNVFEDFVDNNSLTYSFSFSKGIDQFTDDFILNSKCEYNIRYFLYKWKLQSYIDSNDFIKAVQYSTRFLFNISMLIKQNIIMSEFQYNLWFTTALQQLIKECKKYNKKNDYEIIKNEINLLEIYCIQLESVKRQLDIGNTAKENSNYNSIIKKISSDKKFELEMKSILLKLIDLCLNNGFNRKAAIIMQNYINYDHEDKNNYKLEFIKLFIKYKNCNLIKKISKSIISNLNAENKINLSLQILSDENLHSYHKFAANVLSQLFSDYTESSIDLNYPIDITTKIDSNEYVKGKKIEINVHLKCHFKSKVTVPKFDIVFISLETGDYEYLECGSQIISKGKKFKAIGSFKKSGNYLPHCIRMSSNNIVIKSPLPSPQQLITIKESPPPFHFKLITPNFFLPKQWQPFTILFDFVRTVKSLRLSISGVSFETASLIDSQNNMIKPNESFEFGKIESGQYIMNVPIQPYHSGNMLVKGSVHHITVSKSIDFIVADFLDLKLLFSERSMISQLKAFVKKSSNINITIENIEFFSDENDSIQCESEGIPCALSRTVTNALFFLEKKPKFAEIEIKQKEQQTFKIKLGVETIESENMENVEEIVEMDHAPFTIVVPNDYVL